MPDPLRQEVRSAPRDMVSLPLAASAHLLLIHREGRLEVGVPVEKTTGLWIGRVDGHGVRILETLVDLSPYARADFFAIDPVFPRLQVRDSFVDGDVIMRCGSPGDVRSFNVGVGNADREVLIAEGMGRLWELGQSDTLLRSEQDQSPTGLRRSKVGGVQDSERDLVSAGWFNGTPTSNRRGVLTLA